MGCRGVRNKRRAKQARQQYRLGVAAHAAVSVPMGVATTPTRTTTCIEKPVATTVIPLLVPHRYICRKIEVVSRDAGLIAGFRMQYNAVCYWCLRRQQRGPSVNRLLSMMTVLLSVLPCTSSLPKYTCAMRYHQE